MSNTAKKQTRNPAIKPSEEEIQSTMEKVLAENGDTEALLAAMGSDLSDLTAVLGRNADTLGSAVAEIKKGQADARRIIEELDARLKVESEKKFFTTENMLIAAGGVAVGVAGTYGTQRLFRKKDVEPSIED